jgi:hypothetical protein
MGDSRGCSRNPGEQDGPEVVAPQMFVQIAVRNIGQLTYIGAMPADGLPIDATMAT